MNVCVRGETKDHGVAVAQLAHEWSNVGKAFERRLGDGRLEGPFAARVEKRG